MAVPAIGTAVFLSVRVCLNSGQYLTCQKLSIIAILITHIS